MRHSVSNRRELTILKLEETVFDITHAECFRKMIEQMVGNEKSKNIIVDFSQVKAIDSCGISSILLAHQLANCSNGLAIFVSLCQQIKDLLKLTNLDKQLYIFSSINEVVTLIEPARKGRRTAKQEPPQPDYTMADDMPDDIGMIPDEAFGDDTFSEISDEEPEAGLDTDKPAPEAPVQKKRGRPKKSDPSPAAKKKG